MKKMVVAVAVLMLTTSPAWAHPNGWNTWNEYKAANDTCGASPKRLSGAALMQEVECREELRQAWERFDRRYWHSVEQAEEEAAASPAVGGSGGAASYDGSLNWYALADCESGGTWSSGDGIGPDVTGGLQIATSTWLGYGGGAFASKAMYATPAQQIIIGQRVLAGQGVGAWPSCGYRLYT